MSDLLGINEVTELLGVHRDTLAGWRAAGTFPEPDLILSNSPGWHRARVLRWARRAPRAAA